MKKILCTALAFGLFGTASAAEVSGTTDFTVKVPAILILYHWDSASLEFNDFAKAVEDARPHTLTDDLDKTAYNIVQNPIDATNVSDLPKGYDDTKVDVKLVNSWAVRSIAAGANVSLALATQATDLLHEGTGTEKIVVSDATLESVTNTGTTLTLPTSWTPTVGSIAFKIDLSDATKAGTYQSAATRSDATDVFKLTLTGN